MNYNIGNRRYLMNGVTLTINLLLIMYIHQHFVRIGIARNVIMTMPFLFVNEKRTMIVARFVITGCQRLV